MGSALGINRNIVECKATTTTKNWIEYGEY